MQISSANAGSYPGNNFSVRMPTSPQQIQKKPSVTLHYKPANSMKSDFLRSVIGAAAGGTAGAFLVGYVPPWFQRDYDPGTRDDAFYIRSYIGAGFGAALGSATVLYFSKNRDVGYWKIAGAALLPPLAIVLPVSVHALGNEREELLRSAWIATAISIGVSTVWAVFAYRIQPLKQNNRLSLNTAKPFLKRDPFTGGGELIIGLDIIKLNF